METARALRHSVRLGEFAVSLDLSDAYLHVPMHPTSQKFLRFAIDGTVYAFRALPFGLNISPWVFTRIMDAVVASVRQNTASEISNYLDDLLQKNMDPVVLENDLQVLMHRLEELGFVINKEKSDLVPAQDFVHLGMHFKTQQTLVCLPQKRVDKLLDAVLSLLNVQFTTPRQVSQVVGVCAAAAELIPLGRLRIRPIQWAFADLWKPSEATWDKRIMVSDELRQALQCWTLKPWLQRGIPLLTQTATISLCADASKPGWGAHLLPVFATCAGVWSQEEQAFHINELEMLAIYRALFWWKERLCHQTLMVLSDSSTVVAYLRNQGGTHSRRLCLLAMDVLLFCDAAGILISVRHIPGRLNVLADGLSRSQSLPSEWTLNTEVFTMILQHFPLMSVDLFATRLNNRLPVFVSPVPDPRAWAVDALFLDWTNLDLYAFPPTPLIPKILQRLELFQCAMTLIAPLRWNRSWITPLLQRASQIPMKLPVRPDLLLQPGSDQLHTDLDNLNLHVFRLYGSTLQPEVSHQRQWRESLGSKGPPL